MRTPIAIRWPTSPRPWSAAAPSTRSARRGDAPVTLARDRRTAFWKSRAQRQTNAQEAAMADSVYRVTEVIGVSTESWEAAARSAIETAAGSVRDLRIAEVLRQDLTIENGGVVNYRVRLGVSFKYDTGD